ncbi:hypothetical protein [Fusibacter sp. 3D3]|uniref:hypothetical protein n=1 Tax=Fusibacter sp. 3D3 TaxID=1048380 RepID=UPI0008537B38|nr:hypothetical protein [Fusibacter sp. 3D3]GAU77513.1 hypothetical protein F3D3_2142 [Fusibacter sp. 3D3]
MIKNLNLDDQNFDIIVENARKAIRKYAPYWTDENTHDPGITLIELFAWLKEMLQYYMNQTTEPLEYQFLNLFGIQRDFGKPAEVITKVMHIQDFESLPYKTQFSKGRFTFETQRAYVLDPANISDLLLDYEGHMKSVYKVIDNGLTVYPFGPEPVVGSSFYIQFDTSHVTDQIYELYFQVYDDYGIDRNPIDHAQMKDFSPLGTIRSTYKNEIGDWEPIEIIADDTFGLIKSGLVTYKIPSSGKPAAEAFQIRAELISADYDVPPRIIDVFNRIVKLKQTETEPTLYFDATGFPHQVIELPYEEIYYPSIDLEVYDLEHETWQKWFAIDSLYEADKEALCYTFEPEIHSIKFGDQKKGRIPPKGLNAIRIHHLEKSHLNHGNIAVDTLTSETSSVVLKSLTYAVGGRGIKTLEQMKSELYDQMNHTKVAVTEIDFERILKNTPGLMIEKTKCLPLYRPGLQDYPNKLVDNEVSVLVVPYGLSMQNRLNKTYIKNLRREIEKYRMITTEIHILNPVYYDIEVYLELKSTHDHKVMAKQVEQTLKAHYKNDFGQDISKSQFYKLLTEVEGIETIKNIRLSSLQPLSRTKLGDLEIPPYGIGFLKHIEIVWLED